MHEVLNPIRYVILLRFVVGLLIAPLLNGLISVLVFVGEVVIAVEVAVIVPLTLVLVLGLRVLPLVAVRIQLKSVGLLLPTLPFIRIQRV